MEAIRSGVFNLLPSNYELSNLALLFVKGSRKVELGIARKSLKSARSAVAFVKMHSTITLESPQHIAALRARSPKNLQIRIPFQASANAHRKNNKNLVSKKRAIRPSGFENECF